MEASEKPQLPLDEASGDRRRRPRARRPARDRAPDGRATSAPRGSCASAPRPASAPRRRSRRRSRSAPGCSTARRRRRTSTTSERSSSGTRASCASGSPSTLEAGDEMLAERIARSFDGDRERLGPGADRGASSHRARGAARRRSCKLFSAEEGANPLFDFKGGHRSRPSRTLDARQQAERRGEPQADRGADAARWSSSRSDARGRRRASPRPRRPGRARASPSRSASTRRSSGSRRSRGDAAPPHRRRAAEGGGKKGDTLVELGARRAAAGRPDRVRGQGQAAVEERRLGRAQRGHGGAGRRLRGAGRRGRGAGPGGPRAAAPSTRATR